MKDEEIFHDDSIASPQNHPVFIATILPSPTSSYFNKKKCVLSNEINKNGIIDPHQSDGDGLSVYTENVIASIKDPYKMLNQSHLLRYEICNHIVIFKWITSKFMIAVISLCILLFLLYISVRYNVHQSHVWSIPDLYSITERKGDILENDDVNFKSLSIDAGWIESEEYALSLSSPEGLSDQEVQDDEIQTRYADENETNVRESSIINVNISLEDVDVSPCSRSRLKENPGVSFGHPVQFIHLPKAGGATIQDVFRNAGEKNGVEPITQDLGPEACNTRVSYRKSMVLMGHRGWGYCPKVREKMKPFYVVSVREPVSRLISMYDYAMKTYADSRRFALYHKPDYIEQSLDWGVEKNINDLVRRLNTPEEDQNPSTARKMIEGLANQQVRFMCGFDCHGKQRYDMPLTDVTERALQNLRETDAVVVMENMDDLLLQLRYQLSWFPKGMRSWPEHNVVQVKKSIVDDDVRAIIQKWSWADRLLYEAAKIEGEDRTILAKRCIKARSMAKKGMK